MKVIDQNFFCDVIYNAAKGWLATEMKAKDLSSTFLRYVFFLIFITLYKVVLTFQSVDKIFECDHLNESYWVEDFCGSGTIRFQYFANRLCVL